MRRLARSLLATVLGFIVASVASDLGHAGMLDAEQMRRHFPPPFVVGDKARDLPVWPVYKANGPTTELVAWVFESVDLAPIPGFAGVPINLLIALTPAGEYLEAVLLSHHEPVFLDGLGEAPLLRFVAQYRGLGLARAVKIGPPGDADASGTHARIDGVAKATASVRIINQTVLAAALAVARARLGYAGGRDPDQIARIRTDRADRLDRVALMRSGLVGRLRLTWGDVDTAFAGTPMADSGEPAEALFIDLSATLAGVPTVATSLFDPAARAALAARTGMGDQVLVLMADGPYPFLGSNHVRASVPERLALRQGGLPIELRDMDVDITPSLQPPPEQFRAFRIIGQAGLDPGEPMELVMRVTRSRGILYPERIARDFALTVHVPSSYLQRPVPSHKGWQAVWQERQGEIALLTAALLLLSAMLSPPGSRWLARFPRLRRVRLAWLAFTLLFIGWSAQGQLSIVNLTALLQAALAGRGWAFFLFDPISTVLWGYVLLTAVWWGRGTFCGWLCPYGALQEWVALALRHARVPVLRLHRAVDRRLKALKYLCLAAIVSAAVVAPGAADRLVEVEPFKTAITLAFARHWPYVAYAIGLLVLGAVINKFFCRYLCPLGAALAIIGRLRVSNWIARRAECGKPCQTCRHRCEYQAIRADGAIDYAECFQCLDCVAIHASDRHCAPRILAARGKRQIMLQPIMVREVRR